MHSQRCRDGDDTSHGTWVTVCPVQAGPIFGAPWRRAIWNSFAWSYGLSSSFLPSSWCKPPSSIPGRVRSSLSVPPPSARQSWETCFRVCLPGFKSNDEWPRWRCRGRKTRSVQTHKIHPSSSSTLARVTGSNVTGLAKSALRIPAESRSAAYRTQLCT